MTSTTTLLFRAAQSGVATGLRTFTPITVTAWAAGTRQLPLPSVPPFGLLRYRSVLVLCALAAAVEFAGDKLPFVPPRTSTVSLALRTCMGGVVGAASVAESSRTVALGATTGATGAVAGAYAGMAIRNAFTRVAVPDGIVAILEDCVAVVLAACAIRRPKSAVA